MKAEIKQIHVGKSGNINLEIQIITDALKKAALTEALSGYCPTCLRDEFVRVLSKIDFSLAANLTNCKIFVIKEPKLLIEVDDGFFAKMLQREKRMAVLEQVCADYFGHNVTIQVLTAA
jgi:hypothetical protein